MDSNLFKYIWRHSRNEQARILLFVLVSLPFYFVSLDLPRQIMNQGILGKGFDSESATQSFGVITVPLSGTLLGAPVTLFDGVQLEQKGLLLALSLTFLFLICINGGFKFVINTAKGRMGERMLRRLRYELTDRLLRFNLRQQRRMKSAEVATMIKDEVEPLGRFIGEAFVTPAFAAGQAMTAMAFIMVQNVWLGLVAGGIVLFQAVLIPRLRIPILMLGKQRQLTARQLAGRVAEVLDGAVEVRGNDASNWERADVTSRLGRIFDIRFEIYRRKFFVKFLNIFLSQFTPFVFYLGGGLLAIAGHLDVGALVAVIAAYKDLPGPVKELINWEQQRNDVQIKYDQVIEQFQPTDLRDPAQQDPDAPSPELTGDIEASAVALLDESDERLLEGVSFTLPVNSHIAVVGDSASGKEYLTLLMAGLLNPSSGKLRIGGQDVAELPESVTGRRIAYVDPNVYLFPVSVRENLLYSLCHRPLKPPELTPEQASHERARLSEVMRSGNSPLDRAADWVDYEAAGSTGPDDLAERMLEVGLGEDIYRFGLNGSIDPTERPEIAEDILKARSALWPRLEEQGHSDLVMRFDKDLYNNNASLAENLLFGTPKAVAFEIEGLPENPLVTGILEETGLDHVLLDKGVAITRTMVEIFADLPPGHPFFEQFSFISADDLPDFRQLLTRADQRGLDQLADDDRKRLLRLPFRYIEARHRLGLVDEEFAERIVAARRALTEAVERASPDAVEFYDENRYNAAASLMDNILFGRLVYGRAEAEEIVGNAVSELLESLDLQHAVSQVGLDFEVGIQGKRLTSSQRQKLALARALLKRPDLLIINQATAVMDGATRAQLTERLIDAREGRGIVWALERAGLAVLFDHVLVMRNGRVAQQGHYDELNKEGTVLSELLSLD